MSLFTPSRLMPGRQRPLLHRTSVFHVLVAETYVPQTMPGMLKTADLLALYVLAVFWISNVTGLVTGGAAALTYLGLVTLAFFVPCALVTAQLGCLFPIEGSIYAWTEKALGRYWSFFVGLCAWLPGVLSLVSAADVVVNCLQTLNPGWLVPAWQQGLVILAVILFAGVLACQPARLVQNLLNAAAIGIALTVLLIAAAGLFWLLSGHASATLLTAPSAWAIGLNPQTGNSGLLGTVTLALLGATMPLTMCGELAPALAANSKARRTAITRHLLWGSLIVVVGYLIVTLALLLIAGPQAAVNAPNPIALLIGVVDTVLGKRAGDAAMLGLLLFFVLVAVFENVISARLLLVAGIEGRLPRWVTRLNRWRVPAHALLVQTGIALVYTLFLFFVAPLFTALGNPANLTVEAYTVTAASLLLVWAVSFLFPFVDVLVLSVRFPALFVRQRLVPLPVLWLGSLSGMLVCLATIVVTLLSSWLPMLLDERVWWMVVGGLTIMWLVVCSISSMLVTSEARWEQWQHDGGAARRCRERTRAAFCASPLILFTRKEYPSMSHEHHARRKENHWLSLEPHEAPHRSGTSTSASTPGASDPAHPLDPLSAHEIAKAVQIVRTLGYLTAAMRILSLTLHEPPKAMVLACDAARQMGTSQPGVAREVELVVYDPATNTTVEAVVSLTTLLVSWQRRTGVQPAISFAEVLEVERVVKAHPLFREALAKRGITDLDLVLVDSWPAGNYGPEDASTRRLGRPLVYVKTTPEDNGYAHPLDGLHILVDLASMQVLDITDNELLPVPPQQGRYTPESVGTVRSDLKPLTITQPEGASFTVNGYEVRWQKWRFRLGWTPREGLVLYTVGYEDQGRLRPILYRASLAEMIVPYGDPSPLYYRRAVLDMGEHGLGLMANALERGCDCLGHIRYFDAYANDMAGHPVKLPNAICLHEEDAGLLWKHTDFRSGHAEVRRSRRLVVSFIATVGIYDYAFYWSFAQDGSIGFEVKLTGIMNTCALMAGEQPKYGTLVAPQLCAIVHQHFFNLRLDMMVDGLTNSVYETHLETEQPEVNPYGNAFFARDTLLQTEQQAQQVTASLSGRTWKVVNPHVRNGLGQPVGYQLLPGENAVSLARPSSSVVRRAAFITKNLWVTPYVPEERYPAGEYPNQHAGGAGLPQWTQANRSIVETNVVLWYTLGVTHVPRPEDWPVMPVRTVGFQLQPFGFFDRNPALDVPPPPAQQEDGCDC